jgi:hypothetical protein
MTCHNDGGQISGPERKHLGKSERFIGVLRLVTVEHDEVYAMAACSTWTMSESFIAGLEMWKRWF